MGGCQGAGGVKPATQAAFAQLPYQGEERSALRPKGFHVQLISSPFSECSLVKCPILNSQQSSESEAESLGLLLSITLSVSDSKFAQVMKMNSHLRELYRRDPEQVEHGDISLG